MSENPVTSPADVGMETFPWGNIKWLCNDQLYPETEQTLGVVFINPGEKNMLHYHPNCEELLYVISGECNHSLGDAWYHMTAGDMIRIPRGVKHNAINTGWEPVRMLVSYSAPDRQTVMVEE